MFFGNIRRLTTFAFRNNTKHNETQYLRESAQAQAQESQHNSVITRFWSSVLTFKIFLFCFKR